MTTTRQEIVIEGSDDGVTWLAYEFKYKPGDLARRPSWVAPHQPRLDWQMWFAALGDYQSNPWILRFMMRLLEGSPNSYISCSTIRSLTTRLTTCVPALSVSVHEFP